MNLKPFFYLALLLLSLATVVHLFAVAGVDVEGHIGYVWVLHVGIFVAFVPALLSVITNGQLREDGAKVRGLKALKIIFEHTPTWLCWALGMVYVYAFCTFLFYSNTAGGSPNIKDGIYVLENRSGVIRTLTENEFHTIKASILRGFSANWLMFYSFSVSLLYRYR